MHPDDGTTSYDGGETRCHEPPAHEARASGSRKSGRLRLATLNVNGFGRADADGVSDKWYSVNQIMKEQRLAVLAVQEAHLSPERMAAVGRLFEDKLVILNSPDPRRDAGVGGVAFVVNKKSFGEPPMRLREVVPGRAASLTVQWSVNRKLTILNIYAPNKAADNADFWDVLRQYYETHMNHRPDVLLGDFNVVESAFDRLPSHSDGRAPVLALERLTARLKLQDSWRVAHPEKRSFSYLHAASGSQSRLDRIYLRNELIPMAADWDIRPSGVTTDHLLAGLSLANYQSPAHGKGRWRLPVTLLNDPPYVNTMRELGMKLQAELSDLHGRTEERNAQTLFQEFKTSLRKEARARMKVKMANVDRRMAALKEQLDRTLQGRNGLGDEARADDVPDIHGAAVLQDKLIRLEVERFGKRRAMAAAKEWVKGEKIGKYWVKSTIA
ncbi:Endonuclease/exonuclease/phosphatase, partial [Lenzites betulinus]